VLNALPALGMVVGALLGFVAGWFVGVGGPVALGGVGIVAGLLLGIVGRSVFGPGRS
jgi:hypothetical protein